MNFKFKGIVVGDGKPDLDPVLKMMKSQLITNRI